VELKVNRRPGRCRRWNSMISRAPYACDPQLSRGRLYPEPPSKSRSAFRGHGSIILSPGRVRSRNDMRV